MRNIEMTDHKERQKKGKRRRSTKGRKANLSKSTRIEIKTNGQNKQITNLFFQWVRAFFHLTLRRPGEEDRQGCLIHYRGWK